MQQLRIGSQEFQRLFQIEFAFDGCILWQAQLRLKKPCHVADHFVYLYRLKLRLRHLREFAEARNDGFQIGDFRQQCGGTLTKYFLKLLWALLPRARQILYRELQWK